jgi:hypothetical protein
MAVNFPAIPEMKIAVATLTGIAEEARPEFHFRNCAQNWPFRIRKGQL